MSTNVLIHIQDNAIFRHKNISYRFVGKVYLPRVVVVIEYDFFCIHEADLQFSAEPELINFTAISSRLCLELANILLFRNLSLNKPSGTSTVLLASYCNVAINRSMDMLAFGCRQT